jgi:nucleoside-diphosphate-sugar epimerase
MSKILVTGGAGFVGSHLVDYLIADGEKPENIRILIPPWESNENLINDKLDIVRGDIRMEKDVKKSVTGVDVVYHLAAKTIVDTSDPDYYYDTNVEGTRVLLKCLDAKNIKKFIYFSSISVFGLPAWKGNMENVNESWPKKPSEPYGRSKLKAENVVIDLCKKNRIPFIIIRPTTVYGPRDNAGVFQLINIIKANLFFYIGSGQNKMDYVYVKDLVGAARTAEKSQIKNEDFIIGADNIWTQKDIVKKICKLLSKKESKFHINRNLALIISNLVYWFSKLLNVKPLIFPNRVKVLTTNCYFDVTKARKMLHYKPQVDLDTGLKETVDWVLTK